MGHVTSPFVSVAALLPCRGPGRSLVRPMFTGSHESPPAGANQAHSEGCGGRVQVNITAIIRHREAKASQKPNEFMG